MKVVYFPSMCHIFQISLGRQENSLLSPKDGENFSHWNNKITNRGLFHSSLLELMY